MCIRDRLQRSHDWKICICGCSRRQTWKRVEIIKSLDPDYILSPSSLQNDLQPKYASIGEKSLFLDLKSVEGMYASIEGLGQKFGREEEAAVMLAEFDFFMTEFAEKNAGKESPQVLVLMGLPGSYIIATDNSYVGSLVKLAGGTNVYGDGEMCIRDSL